VRRLSEFLLLATLALLPWGGLLRAPALHEHAQWSDLVAGATALAWLASLLTARRRPRLRLVHAALACYLGWAVLSLLLATPRPASGPAKLVGMGMLVALFVLTSELLERPGMAAAVGRTVAATSALTALAAAAGALLALRGVATPLIGGCGDLLPSIIPRAQAGFIHPNLLASYCIFASGVVAREDAGLPRGLVRVLQAALALTCLLTTSRAILGFALAAAIRGATTPARRRLAAGLAVAFVTVMAALSAHNLLLDPARPWAARLDASPSARALAAATSLETLARHPLFGIGPGSSPGFRGYEPFDAHLTPLNVAATLGLPALAALALAVIALWRARRRPTDAVTWGMLAGLGLDGLGQDVEDFRHVWLALGLADAGRRGRT
jgi:hypothetical protein